MKQLAGRVAVVTGGASGIGRAMAQAFLGEDMRVVVADIEPAAVDRAVTELAPLGEVTGVVADVSDIGSVRNLAEQTLAAFGGVHLLCNNAGVGPPAEPHLWDNTPNDWRWTFSVNVLGVAHGISTFLPIMLESGAEGHVVNTASPDGGLVAMANAGVYAASKAAVVTLTECLHAQLEEMGAAVGASVLLQDVTPAASGQEARAFLAPEQPLGAVQSPRGSSQSPRGSSQSSRGSSQSPRGSSQLMNAEVMQSEVTQIHIHRAGAVGARHHRG